MNLVRFLVFSFIVVVFIVPQSADAGFGITPPYVRNTSLTRNSIYEQEILLVRSDPDKELFAEITIEAPGFEDWLEIVQGESIHLPEGATRVPMNVKVRVPDKAEFKNYTGNIRIRTVPKDGSLQAGVNISLGAQVDLDLTVIDKKIFDFRVRKISISELNEGHKWGWLYYPGKIRFSMMLENTGNVPVAPSEVNFRIYNGNGTALLEETSHTNRITKVDPFDTETVIAELPTRLPPGSYRAQYEIKNGDDVKQEGQIILNILPYGTVQAAGYGFMGLSMAHKISVLFPILVSIIIIILSIHYIRSRRAAQR